MRLSRTGLVLLLVALVAGPLAAGAQTKKETLADIRKELVALKAQVLDLKTQLSPTGATGAPAATGPAQQRLDAIEAELQNLTSQTEELQNRINRVVTDGTNRIGDLEFRLVEAEGGDTSKLGKTPTLGGDTGATTAAAVAPAAAATSSGPELAVGEQSDFDRAKAALDSHSFQSAADLFATFAQTYTGGPLTGEAHFFRGEALTGLGQTANAARAYLESFSGSPNGPRAPDALTRLGVSLGKLGQTKEACTTLGQVSVRYPAAPAVADAATAMQTLGCQ